MVRTVKKIHVMYRPGRADGDRWVAKYQGQRTVIQSANSRPAVIKAIKSDPANKGARIVKHDKP